MTVVIIMGKNKILDYGSGPLFRAIRLPLRYVPR
jgi:hypothetical protein